SCPKQSWSSGRVAIVIRRFSVSETTGDGMGYYSTIYNQRCLAFKRLDVLEVDKEVYVERVAYRLKRWAGVQVDRPPFHADKQTPPHKEELCEGCKRGVC
ncbi:Zinc-binding domain containing protein, partial [Rhypophila decipiens]